MRVKRKFRSCPLCYSNKVSLYLRATSSNSIYPSQIQVTDKYFGHHGDIVKCRECQFTYIGKELYVNKIIKLYKYMTDEGYLQEEKERRLGFIRIIKIIERLRGGKSGKIFDSGCCTGGLLVEARRRGWKVYGVDPSEWACRVAKRVHGLTIYNETLELFNRKIRFDVITALDVIEHLKNPKFILNKIYKILNNDGIVCIVTPDYGSLMARLLRSYWWGIRLAHLSYFNKQNITRLLRETGFRIIMSRTYVRYFSLYYIFVRLVPIIDRMKLLKTVAKRITIPLYLFDSMELYLEKLPT